LRKRKNGSTYLLCIPSFHRPPLPKKEGGPPSHILKVRKKKKKKGSFDDSSKKKSFGIFKRKTSESPTSCRGRRKRACPEFSVSKKGGIGIASRKGGTKRKEGDESGLSEGGKNAFFLIKKTASGLEKGTERGWAREAYEGKEKKKKKVRRKGGTGIVLILKKKKKNSNKVRERGGGRKGSLREKEEHIDLPKARYPSTARKKKKRRRIVQGKKNPRSVRWGGKKTQSWKKGGGSLDGCFCQWGGGRKGGRKGARKSEETKRGGR